jgi:hypothetical protein
MLSFRSVSIVVNIKRNGQPGILDDDGYAICPDCLARVNCGTVGIANLERRHRGIHSSTIFHARERCSSLAIGSARPARHQVLLEEPKKIVDDVILLYLAGVPDYVVS